MRGGMEAVYDDVSPRPGFSAFMPMLPARGSLASRHRNWAARDTSELSLENWPEDPPSRRLIIRNICRALAATNPQDGPQSA